LVDSEPEQQKAKVAKTRISPSPERKETTTGKPQKGKYTVWKF